MITNDLFDCGDRDSIKFELIPIVAAVNNLLDRVSLSSYRYRLVIVFGDNWDDMPLIFD